jgi:hypothetical protein
MLTDAPTAVSNIQQAIWQSDGAPSKPSLRTNQWLREKPGYRATVAEGREAVKADNYRLGWVCGQDERFCTSRDPAVENLGQSGQISTLPELRVKKSRNGRLGFLRYWLTIRCT